MGLKQKKEKRGAAPPRTPTLLEQVGALDAAVSRKVVVSSAVGARGAGGGGVRLGLRALEFMGSGWMWFPVPIAYLLSGYATDVQRWVLSNLVLGFLLDAAAVGLIKSKTRRPRPPWNVQGDMDLTVAVDKFSFPSGHTSRAFMIAIVGSCTYGKGAPLKQLGFFAWSCLTSGARVAMGRHYVGDVLAGLFLAFLLTSALTLGTFEPSYFWLTPALVGQMLGAAEVAPQA